MPSDRESREPRRDPSVGPDPEAVFRLVALPLLAGLDDDGETSRSAAWALCLLSRECPDLVDELAERLVEQCRGDESGAVVRTLAHLESWYPDRVRPSLSGTDRPPGTRVIEGEGWSFDRQIRADGGARAPIQQASNVVDSIRDTRPTPPATTLDPSDTDTAATSNQQHDYDRSDVIAGVELASSFESISVVEPPREGRYGEVLRAHATVDGDDRGIALRLFDHGSAGRQFEQSLTERLATWHTLRDVPGVAAVKDFGDHPRPWVATDYAGRTLADVGDLSVSRAIEHARTLANGVATVHERGVVHGGIDPRAVRLSGGELDEPTAPRLDLVGLLTLFRTHGLTGSFLDPRFAAPEHYDATRGGIDQSTDVYGLGGVVYWLCTGRPPFTGSIAELRRAVRSSTPIPPSDVRPALPAGLDDVIEKAMATEKLLRYETARQLLAELRTLG